MEIVVADIGGTHARFAIADISGRQVALGEPHILETGDYRDLAQAWDAFAAAAGRRLPAAAAVAVAADVGADIVRLTNSDWRLDPHRPVPALAPENTLLLNDFAAVAHAVAVAGPAQLVALAGPAADPRAARAISVLGPGTGLGVAQIVGRGTDAAVVPTEAGHIAFAPLTPFEAGLRDRLLDTLDRVSVERVVAGPGLRLLHDALAGPDGAWRRGDGALWQQALSGEDETARRALGAFLRCLGSVAGDIALAQGAEAVIFAGSLANRLRRRIGQDDFRARFCAKGRFAGRMERLPIALLDDPHAGLRGSAVAFARRRASSA